MIIKSSSTSYSLLTVGLVITGLCINIGVKQASAAPSLSFKPAGQQLDGDPIKDIVVTPGQALAFDVNFNPGGELFTQLEYRVEFDTSELSLNSVNAPGASINIIGNNIDIFRRRTDTISNVNAFTDTFNFTVTNPGKSPHDGIRDFLIQNLIASVLVNPNDEFPVDFRDQFTGEIGQFPYIQEVEVQTPEPTSTLSLLALGTLGAVSTLKRKLKPSKFTEKETRKVG